MHSPHGFPAQPGSLLVSTVLGQGLLMNGSQSLAWLSLTPLQYKGAQPCLLVTVMHKLHSLPCHRDILIITAPEWIMSARCVRPVFRKPQHSCSPGAMSLIQTAAEGCLCAAAQCSRDLFGLCATGCLPVDMDSGEVAKWVSNASFATLTLIYSFTQLLDLASQFSTLVGVTLRVGQLLQVFHAKLLWSVSTVKQPRAIKFVVMTVVVIGMMVIPTGTHSHTHDHIHKYCHDHQLHHHSAVISTAELLQGRNGLFHTVCPVLSTV